VLKRLNQGKTYKQVKSFLEDEYDYVCSVSTLRNWKGMLIQDDGWDLRDKSMAPIRREIKFSNKEKDEVVW